MNDQVFIARRDGGLVLGIEWKGRKLPLLGKDGHMALFKEGPEFHYIVRIMQNPDRLKVVNG